MKRKPILLATLVIVVVVGIVATAIIVGKKDSPSTISDRLDSLPNAKLQKDTHDTQRKYDASVLMARVSEYAANNNGRTPKSAAAASRAAASGTSAGWPANDPVTKKAYVIVDTDPGVGEIQYKSPYICDGQKLTHSEDSVLFSVRVRLEDGSFYCIGY